MKPTMKATWIWELLTAGNVHVTHLDHTWNNKEHELPYLDETAEEGVQLMKRLSNMHEALGFIPSVM